MAAILCLVGQKSSRFKLLCTENAESTDEYLEHVSGVNGGASIAARLKEYRSTFVNIDLQIIEELEDLFMKVW